MAIGQQGKAYISVEADLKPFAKDLGREIPRLLKEAEAATKKSLGKAGDEGGKEFRKKLDDQTKKKGGFIGLTSSLAAALDDGISALPAEVKAAIVVGIAASLPVIGALLTGAVAAALIVGFGAIGVLIAAQYDIVRQEGSEVLNDLRNTLVGAGAAFVQPVLDAIELIRTGVQGFSGSLGEVFATASKFVVPLTRTLLVFVESALPGLQAALDNIVDLLPTLERGGRLLGDAFGEALKIITDSDDAQTSLETLIGIITALTLSVAYAIRGFTELYGLLLTIGAFLFPFLAALNNTNEATIRLAGGTNNLTDAQIQAIAATNKQEIAMRKQEAATKAAKKIIDDFIDAQYEYAHSQIDFERALDDVTEAITKQGRTLDKTTEAGRKAREAILLGLEKARQERDDAIASGRLTEEQAQANYENELARLRQRAIQAGVTKKAYDELAGAVGAVGSTPIDLFLSKQAQATIKKIKDAVNAVLSLGAYRPPPATSTPRNRPPDAYATGGIVTAPTLAVVGEAGPEAIVPLSRPKRAAQVMADAGLGGMGDVYVYVGDEQLTSRMYRVARGAQRQQAQRLYAGTRTVF